MYRLAKYLPAQGWHVHVLTTDQVEAGRQDPSLLDSLPPEVSITRVRYVEPTLRGLRGLLRRQTPVSTNSGTSSPAGDTRASTPSSLSNASLLHGMYSGVRRELWQLPDQYWTWQRPAVTEARRIVARNRIPIVLTTFPTWTGHTIGRSLQQDGTRWVADFQDPGTYMFHQHGPKERHIARQRRVERTAVQHADALTAASEGIAMILGDMYGPKARAAWHAIPIGLDERIHEERDTSLVPTYPYLVFPGRFSAEYGTEFFQVLAGALDDPTVRATGIRLLVVGDIRSNRRTIAPLIKELGLGDRVELMDTVPQRQLMGLVDGALAGVLLDGSTARWWCIHAKAAEYLGLQKPVLARIPEVSVSRLHLERSGLGVFLDGSIDSAARTLRAFINGTVRAPDPDPHYCERFTSTEQAASFARLFDSLLTT